MKVKTVAKAAILNEAGKVLLLRRSQTDTWRPGDWDFPGGGVEPGEDITAGVIRELVEETGLRLEAADLTLVYTKTEPWEPDDKSINRFLFVGRLTGDRPVQLSFEHDLLEWMDIDVALQRFTHFFYNPALRYARDHDLLPL